MKKILVALDGSKHSKKGVELAIDLARKWKAEIYLVHVQERLKMPKGFAEYAKVRRIPPSNYFAMVCERDQFLGEAEDRVKKAGVKMADPICVQGDPADQIINAAKRNRVDMVIMGNRGLGGLKKAFMGSVSTKVCNQAPCTCVTVK